METVMQRGQTMQTSVISSENLVVEFMTGSVCSLKNYIV